MRRTNQRLPEFVHNAPNFGLLTYCARLLTRPRDEVSMMDTEAWNAIAGIMSCIDHNRRPQASRVAEDPFGALHVLLFGYPPFSLCACVSRPSSQSHPYEHIRRPHDTAHVCPIRLRCGRGGGDFKQLPPATSKAPFIVVPWVVQRFDFRVLRQNRCIVAGTDDRRNDC